MSSVGDEFRLGLQGFTTALRYWRDDSDLVIADVDRDLRQMPYFLFAIADASGWESLLVPTNPTEFWTLALTLATLGLAGVAFFGLRSVSLSKADMKNRNTREAAQATVDLCVEMARELLPEYTAVMAELHRKGIALFVGNAGEVSFAQTEEARKINQAICWMGQLDGELLQQVIAFMNHLETWSMSFTHDPSLADETVAFEPCSSVFCQMVMSMYPMLLTQRRTNPASGPFQNTVTLFQGWYGKKAKDQLLEQLKRVQADRPQLPPTIGS
jgi:hypothetical protein